MDAVEELHYEVNMVAKGLKSGRTHNIAVVVNSLTSIFFPPLLQSIQGDAIDGLIAGNDQMAIGAMRAIMDSGLKIPEDVAVIGYDDNFPASLVQMSSISIPKEEMGKMALELLMRRIENPNASRMLISLNGDLVIRNSTIAGTKSTWDLENW